MLSQVSLLNLGASSIGKTALKASTSGSGGVSSFETLMQGLFSQGISSPSAYTAAQSTAGATASSSVGESGSYADGYETPLDSFRRAVRESGESADDLNLPKEQEQRLENALVESGYKRAEAKAAISQAQGEDGKINLGKLFKALDNFKPSEVSELTIESGDLPALLQVLRDFGVSEEKLTAFANKIQEAAATQGDATAASGQLKVTGLANLLAGVDEQGYQMDRGVLTDLLKRIGLDDKEISALLSRNMDSQERLTPTAMLKVLQAAAAKQDNSLADSFRTLASNVTKGGQQNGISFDAQSLAAKVSSFLEKGQGPKAAAFDTALEEHARQAAKTAETTDKLNLAAKSETSLPRGARTAASNGQAQTASAAESKAKSTADASGGATAKVEVKDGARADTSIDPSKAVKAAGKGLAAGDAATGSQQAAAATGGKSTLPAYVVRQVAYQMGQMVARQQNTLKLTLNPEHLGKVDLTLDVASGTVKATLVADTLTAKHALESGMDELKSQLTAQGLKVEKIDVMLNPDAQKETAGETQQQQWSGRRGGRGGTGAANAATGADSAEEVSSAVARAVAETVGRINLIA